MSVYFIIGSLVLKLPITTGVPLPLAAPLLQASAAGELEQPVSRIRPLAVSRPSALGYTHQDGETPTPSKNIFTPGTETKQMDRLVRT